MKPFVTTSFKPNLQMIERASYISDQLKLPFCERGNRSLNTLIKENQSDTFILIEKNKNSIISKDQAYFFHPSLAKLRIKSIREGNVDNMLESMGLEQGDSVLDCTLGLGADAIVASFAVGQKGRVVGLESSSLISLLVKQGLMTYPDTDQAMTAAMHRIEVINESYEDYLSKLPANYFDIVYFDPMFRQPLQNSDAISAIRSFTNQEPISLKSIQEAVRVAKKCVVIKERRNSREFERLKCTRIHGGKYSPIAYGIIEVDNN